MKRVWSVLLICALLVAGLAVVASAAPASLTIAVDSASAYKSGDIVTATVNLNDYTVDSWSVMTAVVTYNSDALTFVSAESAMEGMQVDSTVAGKLLLCWIADPLVVPTDGVVAELTFTAKEVAEDQPIDLKVGFYPEGMVLAGDLLPMENIDDANYSSVETESDPIVIQPEQPAAPSTGTATLGGQYGVKAEEIPAVGLTHGIDVYSAYNRKDRYVDTYKVVLTWTDLKLTYNDATIKTWDADIHEWIPNTDNNKWTKGTLIVEVANHSSDDVTVGMTYNDAVGGPVTKAADVEPIPVDAYNEQTKAAGEGTLSSEVSVESGAITKDEGDAAITLGTFTVTVK